MQIVKKIPRHVTLSKHLRARAPFFILVTEFGVPYYIAATPKVRQMLKLDIHGKPATPKQRRIWRDQFDNDDALRDVIASIHLQLRDVVLTGIEQDVTDTLLDKMREAMHPTVAGMIEKKAEPATRLMLNVGGNNNFVSQGRGSRR
jgi:hypothetical protein